MSIYETSSAKTCLIADLINDSYLILHQTIVGYIRTKFQSSAKFTSLGMGFQICAIEISSKTVFFRAGHISPLQLGRNRQNNLFALNLADLSKVIYKYRVAVTPIYT